MKPESKGICWCWWGDFEINETGSGISEIAEASRGVCEIYETEDWIDQNKEAD